FIDLITVGTSTTPRLAFRQLSIVYGASLWFFGLVLGLTPSKLMYRLLRPLSRRVWARLGLSARLIPFVLSWMWSTPSSLMIRTISGSSGRRVGSPPVIWSEFPGTGLSALSARTISLTWSRVGSYTYAPSSP